MSDLIASVDRSISPNPSTEADIGDARQSEVTKQGDSSFPIDWITDLHRLRWDHFLSNHGSIKSIDRLPSFGGIGQ
jgi:hypothetical protein